MDALIAGLADLVTAENSPFDVGTRAENTRIVRCPSEEYGQLQATHETVLENIRQYTPPLLGVPYVQLIIDSDSYPVRLSRSWN